MNNPLFSIIVPVYNVEPYIATCIESILCQSVTDFELLLVDDESTDDSGMVCDEFASKDSRVRVFHQDNSGVSCARNLGIEKAQGKYICFVDPDDWIEASFLYVINKQIGDCDILVIGFDFDYEDGSTMHVSIGDLEARQVCDKEECMLRLKFNATGHNIFGYIWNKVFKADIIKTNKISFLKDVKFGEDEFFTLACCLCAHSLKIIPIPIYHYRQRPGSLVHQADTLLSVKHKYPELLRLIPFMQTKALRKICHKWAYHILQDIAKKSNPFFYLYYHAKAFAYKWKYL